MAMPESTPRRPGKTGQNRDSRDGGFGHPESQVGPLPRVGLYARVSTPQQHTIGMQLRQLAEGRTIRDIARATGREEETVRWHKKHVFSKVGVSRQVDLVRLLLSLADIPRPRR